MSSKEKKPTKGIFGVQKSVHKQVRPFGRHSDPYPSDDSEDSDYEPNHGEQSETSKQTNNEENPKPFSRKVRHGEGNVTGVKKSKTASKSMVSETLKACSSKAWSDVIPNEILLQIFLYSVASQGPIPLLSR